MSVHFPRLALETHRIQPMSNEPVVVTQGIGTKISVWDCTLGASRLGVRPGMPLNAALALTHTLEARTLERDLAAEHGVLLKLASLGHDFTPTVSIESPGSLLLEVEGSAHLFGGTGSVCAHARDKFSKHGFMPMTSMAPTPLAALWLAYAGVEIVVTDAEQLRGVLGRLPVQSVAWSREIHDAFNRLGIQQLGDLLRLPREGLARRFGKQFLDTLDRALGHRPDPRLAWDTPKTCSLSRELPGEFIQVDHMLPYVDAMVEELCGQLRRHDAAVNRLKLKFRHWHQEPTSVAIGSAVPYRETIRWLDLVHGRLGNLMLPAPVHEIELHTGRFMPYTAVNNDFVGDRASTENSIQRLVDLLRSRVGRKKVSGVVVTPDARPADAWASAEPGEATKNPRVGAHRPLYVLPEPEPLGTCSSGKPRYNGASLSFLSGPERIEGGWWAEEAWIRDYYQATSTRGERLWIFREGKHWFLHGSFS
jgi:protein ImuB